MLKSNKKQGYKKIVVTGVGPITSIGVGKNDLWQNILKRKKGVRLVDFKLKGEKIDSAFLYPMKKVDVYKLGIDKQMLDEMRMWKRAKVEDDTACFLAAIKLALDDSALKIKNGSRVGMILTHENPGAEQFYNKLVTKTHQILREKKGIERKEYFSKIYSAFSRNAYDQQTFMYLFHIAKIFGVHGYSLFINNACASGLYAIELGSQLIVNGTLDAVIIAAVDSPGLLRNIWLKENKLYSKNGKIKPFSSERNGFVLGQGGAAVVLEDYATAKKRRATIYAQYIGGRFALESWKVTLPDIRGKHYRRIIQETLKYAGIEPNDVDLVNAHGVGTSLTDRYEANAINQVFSGKRKVLVNALKPFIGHTLGASALIETAMLLLSMKKNIILPTLNVAEPDRDLEINLATDFIRKKHDIVLKLSCGFGGYDGSIILRNIEG